MKRLDSSAEKISEPEDSNRNCLKWNTVRKKTKKKWIEHQWTMGQFELA